MFLNTVRHSALAGRKQEVLATAAQLIKLPVEQEVETPQQAARSAAVAAVSIHWRGLMKRYIEEQMGDVYSTYEMIEGAFEDTTDAAAWHNGLESAMLNGISGTEVMPYLKSIHEQIQDADLQEPGRIAEVADDLAAMLVECDLPQGNEVGKWLAAAGIVKIDLDWLANQMDEADQLVLPGVLTADIDTAPVLTDIVPPSFTIIEEGDQLKWVAEPPDKAAISRAYQLLGDPSTTDLDVLCKLLGFSRSTLANYMSGRTQGKCNAVQAAVVLEEINRRIATLQEAAAVFGAVA